MGNFKDIKNHPQLESVIVWGMVIDIFIKDISIALFEDDFSPIEETLEYNY